MLKDYYEQLAEKRSKVLLNERDYADWKRNPLTVRFLEDMEIYVVKSTLEGVMSIDINKDIRVDSQKFCGMRDVMGFAEDWKPSYIEED